MPRPTSHVRTRVMVICHYWEERFLQGVAEYARSRNWILDIALRHSRRMDLLPVAWTGRGVIANTMGNAELTAYVAGLKVPVVLAQGAADVPGAPTVMHDEREIGRVAARHFLELGFERFLFVAPERMLGSERGAGMEEAAAGKSFRRVALERLGEALSEARAPVAILAVNDTYALDALSRIERAGLRVPRDCALMGVDDDAILCSLGAVPLTSVNLDFEGRGRACAALLDAMIRGDRKAVRNVVTPIGGVTVRESTNTLAIPHPAAAEALRFIRENYRKPVTLKDLETELGCPLRGVQDVFKRHVGLTLAGEMARLRREAALAMLADPKVKLEAVASACGYAGRFHLSRALLRETGMTPRLWRRQFKESASPTGRKKNNR